MEIMGINIGKLKNRKAVEDELKKIEEEEAATLKLIEEIEEQANNSSCKSLGFFQEWFGSAFNFVKYKSKINGK